MAQPPLPLRSYSVDKLASAAVDRAVRGRPGLRPLSEGWPRYWSDMFTCDHGKLLVAPVTSGVVRAAKAYGQ